MDTDTTTRDDATAVAEPAPDPDAELKLAYPAVTQFKGRTIRYAPLTEGQVIALNALDRDDEDRLAPGAFSIVLAVLEGCVGPDQWQRISLDLARKRIDAADITKLFVKIMDKMRRDADKATKA